ncbi:hypothetical protein PsAD13_04463 [Pseudovibrio sp. Ad13]|nr:hypothetical protein PsAD13_04463 [Pseudovibrio sp. Ad13]
MTFKALCLQVCFCIFLRFFGFWTAELPAVFRSGLGFDVSGLLFAGLTQVNNGRAHTITHYMTLMSRPLLS